MQVTGVSSDYINLTWSAASPPNLNGNLLRYEVLYHIVLSANDTQTVGVNETSDFVRYTLSNLESGRNFSIQVCIEGVPIRSKLAGVNGKFH